MYRNHQNLKKLDDIGLSHFLVFMATSQIESAASRSTGMRIAISTWILTI